MEEQQPGQVYAPQSNNDQPHTETPTDNQQGQQTSDEISQIDSAVAQSDTPPQPEPPQDAETTSAPITDSQPQPPATESNEQPVAAQTSAEAETSQPGYAQEQQTSANTENDGLLMRWQAAEPKTSPITSLKPVLVFGGLSALVLAIVIFVAGLNFSTILAILAISLGVIALYVSNHQHGHLEEYELHESGVSIAGRYYPFEELQSFGVVSTGNAYGVELVMTKRFMPRLTLHLEPTSAEEVVETLAQYLPQENREPDLIDRVYHLLGM